MPLTHRPAVRACACVHLQVQVPPPPPHTHTTDRHTHNQPQQCVSNLAFGIPIVRACLQVPAVPSSTCQGMEVVTCHAAPPNSVTCTPGPHPRHFVPARRCGPRRRALSPCHVLHCTARAYKRTTSRHSTAWRAHISTCGSTLGVSGRGRGGGVGWGVPAGCNTM